MQRSINYHKENKGGMCLIIRALAKGLAIVNGQQDGAWITLLKQIKGPPR